jgi:hypothetical protein
MQVVCEATQSDYAELQIAAFQCLVRIMQTYYDKMRIYMEKALFGVKRKKKYKALFLILLLAYYHWYEQ